MGFKKGEYKDLTGIRFGKLLVLSLNKCSVRNWKRQTTTIRYWNCKCDCGKETVVQGPSLIKGSSKSCGCYAIELLKKRNNVILRKSGAAFRRLLLMYRSEAKRRNIEWHLSSEDFRKLTSSPCYYTGKPPEKIIKTRFEEYVYNGVDRVDNSVGYTIDNCVPCCHDVNIMKNTLSKNKFIYLCNLIAERFKQK